MKRHDNLRSINLRLFRGQIGADTRAFGLASVRCDGQSFRFLRRVDTASAADGTFRSTRCRLVPVRKSRLPATSQQCVDEQRRGGQVDDEWAHGSAKLSSRQFAGKSIRLREEAGKSSQAVNSRLPAAAPLAAPRSPPTSSRRSPGPAGTTGSSPCRFVGQSAPAGNRARPVRRRG